MREITIEALAGIVESVAGADPTRNSRSRPVVEARTLLVHALRAQGKTQEQVAAAIGYPRITIQHYDELWRDAVNYNNNPPLLARWAKLQTILDL